MRHRSRYLLPLTFAALLLPSCASAPAPEVRPFPAPSASAPPPSPPLPGPPATPAVSAAPTERTPAQRARDAELLPKATATLTAFSNGGAHLTRSGAVLFTSNRDGLTQLYVGDAAHPSDPPRRLPTPKERVQGATLTPDERTVLYASDVGADGNFHIFRIGLDGSALTDLTPGEKLHRDRPIVARSKPGLFAYSAHAPSSEKTTVYLQSPESTPRPIYSDARGGSLEDLSPDGARALFARSNSDQDVVIYEVASADGNAIRIFPPLGEPSNASAVYSAAGERVLATRTREGRPGELVSLDPKTGKTGARYEETTLPDASIDGVLVSPGGDWVAISVNGGNRSVVRVLDARSLRLRRTIETPLGVAVASEATQDGKRFTIVESHPDAPMDVYVVDAATGAVTPLRSEERPGLTQATTLRVSIERIPSFDGLAIPTNLYLPAAAAAASSPPARLPTLVSIHGGPSSSAQIRWNPPLRFYASLGYAIVEPNIRGSTGFGVAYEKADDKEKRAGALKDVEAINAWARAQPWCDPERLVIMGGSYGGYMTLLAVARQPTLWRAGLDISGMSDLRTMEKLEDQSIRVYDETEFGVLGKDDDLLFEWSPLKYVDRIVAPVFVYQGANDPVTPQNEADQIVKALRQRKVPVEYMLLANEGHGLSRRENSAEYLARTARFLEEHAGGR